MPRPDRDLIDEVEQLRREIEELYQGRNLVE